MNAAAARILVVDDEVGMREGCRRALTSAGFRVDTAEHAADGLRKLREESFDLVLVDMMMPGMSGLELLERIRERDPHTACVMITGYATVDLAVQAMKQGAGSFLPKPFTSDELLTAVLSGLEERRQHLARLDQEAQEEDARQIERARQDLARLDAVQSRFMLVLVHELRNPAGVLKNYVQLMRSGYVDDDEWDDYLEKLDGRASQLLNMLDELLELSHLKALDQPPQSSPLPVADVLEEVVRELSAAADRRGVTVSTEVRSRPAVLAQRSHVRSLWSHLIDNAIQYTPGSGTQATRGGSQPPRVEISLTQNGGLVQGRVADTGIGIHTDELGQIFQEFYRSPAARELMPFGTGLGLAIVNQVIKLYHGSIQVESKPGQGCVVSFVLPAAPQQPDRQS